MTISVRFRIVSFKNSQSTVYAEKDTKKKIYVKKMMENGTNNDLDTYRFEDDEY
jgi:hypothetical protein